jgi:hypothetical protein
VVYPSGSLAVQIAPAICHVIGAAALIGLVIKTLVA